MLLADSYLLYRKLFLRDLRCRCYRKRWPHRISVHGISAVVGIVWIAPVKGIWPMIGVSAEAGITPSIVSRMMAPAIVSGIAPAPASEMEAEATAKPEEKRV